MTGMKWIHSNSSKIVPQHTENYLFYIDAVTCIRRDEKYVVQIKVKEDIRATYYEDLEFFNTIKECKEFVKNYVKYMKGVN